MGAVSVQAGAKSFLQLRAAAPLAGKKPVEEFKPTHYLDSKHRGPSFSHVLIYSETKGGGGSEDSTKWGRDHGETLDNGTTCRLVQGKKLTLDGGKEYELIQVKTGKFYYVARVDVFEREFKIDDIVEVKRTDGSWTQARIISRGKSVTVADRTVYSVSINETLRKDDVSVWFLRWPEPIAWGSSVLMATVDMSEEAPPKQAVETAARLEAEQAAQKVATEKVTAVLNAIRGRETVEEAKTQADAVAKLKAEQEAAKKAEEAKKVAEAAAKLKAEQEAAEKAEEARKAEREVAQKVATEKVTAGLKAFFERKTAKLKAEQEAQKVATEKVTAALNAICGRETVEEAKTQAETTARRKAEHEAAELDRKEEEARREAEEAKKEPFELRLASFMLYLLLIVASFLACCLAHLCNTYLEGGCICVALPACFAILFLSILVKETYNMCPGKRAFLARARDARANVTLARQRFRRCR